MNVQVWLCHLAVCRSLVAAALLLVTATTPALGVEEQGLAKRYFAEFVPFVQNEIKSTFNGRDGVPIAYRMFRHAGAKGGIVLVHGYGESTLKNAELIHDLIRAGYNVYSFDLRGMGESGRMLANPQIGHVASFDDYVEDLKTFVGTIVKPVETLDLFLIGHSTGGLASALLLEQHDNLFKAVAWSAPLFRVQSRAIPYWLAYSSIWAAVKLGYGERYVPFFGDYDAKDDQPEKSHVTHSLIRAQNASLLYKQMPQLRIAGTSNSWVYNAANFGAAAVAAAAKIQTPILLIQAGADVVVSNEAQRAFCEKAPHCHLVLAAEAKHEVLNEVDPIRDTALKQMLDFFASNATVHSKANARDY